MSQSITVEVHLDDIFSEIKTRDLIAEIGYRGYLCVSRDSVIDAINMIRSRRYDDAVVLLEREFLPKWTDRAQAEEQYRAAMEAL